MTMLDVAPRANGVTVWLTRLLRALLTRPALVLLPAKTKLIEAKRNRWHCRLEGVGFVTLTNGHFVERKPWHRWTVGLVDRQSEWTVGPEDRLIEWDASLPLEARAIGFFGMRRMAITVESFRMRRMAITVDLRPGVVELPPTPTPRVELYTMPRTRAPALATRAALAIAALRWPRSPRLPLAAPRLPLGALRLPLGAPRLPLAAPRRLTLWLRPEISDAQVVRLRGPVRIPGPSPDLDRPGPSSTNKNIRGH